MPAPFGTPSQYHSREQHTTPSFQRSQCHNKSCRRPTYEAFHRLLEWIPGQWRPPFINLDCRRAGRCRKVLENSRNLPNGEPTQ
jgi:hypothetical protein